MLCHFQKVVFYWAIFGSDSTFLPKRKNKVNCLGQQIILETITVLVRTNMIGYGTNIVRDYEGFKGALRTVNDVKNSPKWSKW